MTTPKPDRAEDIVLIPFNLFSKTTKEVLSKTKRESDAQLARFQAANVKKRRAKRQRKEP
jgi:hypothetical protein